MRSRTSLTNLEMVADPFMSLTNKGVVLKLRKKSFKLPLKRLRLL